MKTLKVILLVIFIAAMTSVVYAHEGYQGCTPGYWKNHPEAWEDTAYSPNDLFSDVFGMVITIGAGGQNTIEDPTLMQALNATGGGVSALARHAVAGILNASHPDINYPRTIGTIIYYVTVKGLATDNPDTIELRKDRLDEWNNLGCPDNEILENATTFALGNVGGVAPVTILSTVVSAREGLDNLYVRGDQVVCDYTNELCWYPVLTDTMDMTKDEQEDFIKGISAAGYGGITEWKMAKYDQVQDLKDSLAGMAEIIEEHEWPWTQTDPPPDRTVASPFNAWPVQVDEFFTPTHYMDQPMDPPMPDLILGGGRIWFFNGRTRGWGWRSGSPLEPPVWAKGEADDHFVTTEYMTPGQFATMTWNYDVHYLPDDATTRMGFPGPFGAWIVSETTPIELHIIFLEDLVTSMDLHDGIENSLVSILEKAGKSTQKGNAKAAVNGLESFINEVEAQRDKEITDEQANILIGEAQSIIDLFNNGWQQSIVQTTL